MFDHIPIQLEIAFACIFGLLLASHILTLCIAKANPGKDYTELKLRIRSWWYIIIIFSISVMANRGTALCFLAFISFLALKEFLSLIPTRRADRRVLFWAYLSIPMQYYCIYISWYGLFIILIPVVMFLFLPLRMVIIGQTKGFIQAVSTTQWGLMITVFSISHAAYLLSLPYDGNPHGGGPSLLFYLVILTQLNDVAQYVWGKSFGRKKILPTVSPGKTVAGFLGGVATTIVVSYFIAPHLTPLDMQQSLLAGLIISMGGFVGDVTISAIKRDLGIKDSSQMIPGHGGVLDRVDSLTYAAPLFFHYIYFVSY